VSTAFSIWRFHKRLLYGLLPGEFFAEMKRRPVVTRWQILAIALVLAEATATDCVAQLPTGQMYSQQPAAQNPDFRYAVTPQAGEWLICVQTFKGAQAQVLAEQMAEMMMRDYRIPAYLHVRGRKERGEEEERVQQLRKQYDDMVTQLRSQNAETTAGPFRVARFARIDEEFAVLITDSKHLKDMDAAHDFLVKKVRKLPPPPKEFSTLILGDMDSGGKTSLKGDGYLNPFFTAIVAHNPTIPIQNQQQNPEVADDFLKKMNAEEPLSVLKCSKPYTVVVKMYKGQTVFEAPESPTVLRRFTNTVGLTKKEPEILNAQAKMAQQLANLLRNMKPSFEAYVMHQASYSIVTVGQFDSLNDPNLAACQRSLAGFQLCDSSPKSPTYGVMLEKLSVDPLPMKIPR
jgi:hypothetical protein